MYKEIPALLLLYHSANTGSQKFRKELAFGFIKMFRQNDPGRFDKNPCTATPLFSSSCGTSPLLGVGTFGARVLHTTRLGRQGRGGVWGILSSPFDRRSRTTSRPSGSERGGDGVLDGLDRKPP